MKAEALLREGKLDEAVDQVSAYLRDNPADTQARTFLFELLCFRGEYDRARKHLILLAQGNKDASVAALVYHGAMAGEETRKQMFDSGGFPAPLAEGSDRLSGSINGKPFATLSDPDPRIGARLEVFAAGDYLWIPFEHVASLTIGPPKRLRDLLWATAQLKTGPGFHDREFGEVLIPALAPQSSMHPEAEVRLGRVTEWCADETGQEAPYGAKTLLVDGVEVPLLEIRTLEVAQARTAAQ